jgi:hypothetical protein
MRHVAPSAVASAPRNRRPRSDRDRLLPAPPHNDSLELTRRPSVVLRPELRPGRPAAHFRRYAVTKHPTIAEVPTPRRSQPASSLMQ